MAEKATTGSRGAAALSGHAIGSGPDENRHHDAASSPSGVFIAVEGIDGAGKTTAARIAAEILRSRKRQAVCVAREDVAWHTPYIAEHMAALRDLIWGEPPDTPYLDLGDEHWVHLQASWYAAFARCVVAPAVAEGTIVLADTWGYKFLAKLALRPPERVSLDFAWSVFHSIQRPALVVHLHADPTEAAARKAVFSGSETGNREGTPELSRAAFANYQSGVAEVLESFAGRGGWACVDTFSLTAAEVGLVVADLAEQRHLALVGAEGTGEDVPE